VEQKTESELEKAARDQPRVSLLKDFWFFLLHNKKWWLLPILLVLLVLSLLLVLSATGAAPFIYTLF
jgi:Family of unknown function (DUF5989)